MFHKIAVTLAGVVAGLAVVFAPVSHAATSTVTTVNDVCKTGFRGQPAYDKKCLRTGTVGDAAKLWYGTPVGSTHVRDDDMTRRNLCAFAYRHGGVRAAAVDMVTDMTYDTYRNNRQVNVWVADMAQGDCLRLGYADQVSGLVSVSLKSLPHAGCWYEVYYFERKVIVEPLCQ
jgi:hypothetical protein